MSERADRIAGAERDGSAVFLRWALCGVLTGLLMALGEYFFLSITVEGFATGGELLVFAGGLSSTLGVLGGVAGMALFGLARAASVSVRFLRFLARKARRGRGGGEATGKSGKGSRKGLLGLGKVCGGVCEALRRAWSATWMKLSVGVFGTGGVFLGVAVNALAYHRLYAGYHGLLSGLTFLCGFVGVANLIALARKRMELDQRLRLRRGLAATSAILVVGVVAGAPRLVTNENLKAIVADRGVTSAHIYFALSAASDGDGDGFAPPPFGYDCDDSTGTRHPMRYDAPGNGKDEDCTGGDRQPPKELPAPPKLGGSDGGQKKEGTDGAGGRNVSFRRIIVITIDCLRADRWPVYAKRNVIPNIFRLSTHGFAFHRAYATSNWTVPSVYSVLTGRYPFEVRFVKAMLDFDDNVALIDPESDFAQDESNMRKLIPVPGRDEAPTLAEELKKRGYETATILDTPFLKPEMGMARGFDIVDQSPYEKANRSLEGVTAHLMAERALHHVRAHREELFFLYMHLSEPHAPYHKHPNPTDLGDSAEDRYDSELRFVDDRIGYLLGEMQKEGLLADALVVITSDHGEEFRDHGGLYHASTVYEEQIRVPLVFFGPNMRRRQTIQPVSLVDIFPTILSLVDGTEDRHLASGVDLSKWLRTTNAPGRMLTRSIYAESRRFGNWKQTVVANRFKLIRDNKAGASMLFDLHRDPGETKNLISKRKDLANELLGMMHALLDR